MSPKKISGYALLWLLGSGYLCGILGVASWRQAIILVAAATAMVSLLALAIHLIADGK